MSIGIKPLTALGGLLAGANWNGPELQACLHGMANSLARHTGSMAKARRVLLESFFPDDKRQRNIAAALLANASPARRQRGRPRGSRGGKAYNKAFALYDIYCSRRAVDPTLTKEKFAQYILGLKGRSNETSEAYIAAVKSVILALRRAEKTLAEPDRKLIEVVATEIAATKLAGSERG